MKQHILIAVDLIAAAKAGQTEKWEEDIAAFDDIFTEMMTVSDTLSEGIIKQFPDRF